MADILKSIHQGDLVSQYVTPGPRDSFMAMLQTGDVAVDTAFMLVDLSDTTNWPHAKTGIISVEGIHIHINPAAAFRGEVVIGWLSGVDATNGDLNKLTKWDFTQLGTPVTECICYLNLGGFHCKTDNWFGQTLANDVLFQTDVNLKGPDGGAAAYPSGNGDLVLRIDRTAGNASVALEILYHTDEA